MSSVIQSPQFKLEGRGDAPLRAHQGRSAKPARKRGTSEIFGANEKQQGQSLFFRVPS
jgi:hypothetical protein